MTRRLFVAKVLTLCLSLFGLVSSVHADPANDLRQVREYFKKRFPTVRLDSYANGLDALPGMEDYRAQWESHNEFPPYEFGLDAGRKEWETPFKNGKTYASCFVNDGKNVL